MTITKVTKTVGDKPHHGYEIKCSTADCPQTSFVHTAKRLPMQVVTKKFQERRWEVNKGGGDICPLCIDKRRPHKARLAPMAQHLEPEYETLPIASASIVKIATEAGFGGIKITELQAKGEVSKFKIAFPSAELPHGKIIHVEGQILQRCKAQLATSYFKSETTHEANGNIISIETHLAWVLGLAPAPVALAAE